MTTLSLYPDIVMKKDLSPDSGFGSDIDDICQELVDATKGWGANKQKVVDALATQDSTARTKISMRFKELNEGKDLVTLMKKEFSGDLGTALEFLALPPDEAECAMLKMATAGIGSRVNVVWSILIGRTNEEMDHLKKTYFRMYNRDIGKLLAKELTSNMERLVFNCLQGAEEVHDPQYHTNERAMEDAEIIYKKGQGRMGTEERGMFKVICSAPREHLENINRIYADKYGYTLPKVMEKEMSGNLQDAAVHLVEMKLKPVEAVAKLFKTACAGMGTDEMLLTCCCIRYQLVLPSVVSAHIELYHKSIHDRVRSETGGMFKTLLVKVLDVGWPESG